jgi:hypothetical protein
MYERPAELKPWIMPVAIVAILGLAGASVVVCLVLGDGAGGEDFPDALFAFVLLIVALSEIVATRFFVLPTMLTRAQTVDEATPQGVADSMTIISVAFSIASAIYGLVVAALTANLLYVAPFPVLAAIMLIIFIAYSREAIDALAAAKSVEGVR